MRQNSDGGYRFSLGPVLPRSGCFLRPWVKSMWVKTLRVQSLRSGVRLERRKVDRLERQKVDRLERRKVT